MYTGFLIFLLTTFIAMLGGQWPNRYLQNLDGPMFERCGGRQRKYDRLEKWPLYLFIENVLVIPQVTLLACELCRYTWPVNTPVWLWSRPYTYP